MDGIRKLIAHLCHSPRHFLRPPVISARFIYLIITAGRHGCSVTPSFIYGHARTADVAEPSSPLHCVSGILVAFAQVRTQGNRNTVRPSRDICQGPVTHLDPGPGRGSRKMVSSEVTSGELEIPTPTPHRRPHAAPSIHHRNGNGQITQFSSHFSYVMDYLATCCTAWIGLQFARFDDYGTSWVIIAPRRLPNKAPRYAPTCFYGTIDRACCCLGNREGISDSGGGGSITGRSAAELSHELDWILH